MASLMMVSGQQALTNLYRRGMFDLFDTGPLVVFLLLYFALALITSGMALPSGLMVPLLLIGAVMGRIVANIYLASYRGLFPPNSVTGDGDGSSPSDVGFLFDPAVFAIVGSASMLVGSGRITLAFTVIMLETTADLTYLPPLAIAAITAQWVGNCFNHGLYHMLLQLQGVPYLRNEPTVEQGVTRVASIMSKNVVSFNVETTVAHIKTVLWDSDHNGFPVLNNDGTLVGMIVRMELQSLVDGIDALYDGTMPRWSNAIRCIDGIEGNGRRLSIPSNKPDDEKSPNGDHGASNNF